MNTKTHLTATADDNGVLHLRIPTDAPRQKFKIVVSLEPLNHHTESDRKTDGGAKAFKDLIGSISFRKDSSAAHNQYIYRTTSHTSQEAYKSKENARLKTAYDAAFSDDATAQEQLITSKDLEKAGVEEGQEWE